MNLTLIYKVAVIIIGIGITIFGAYLWYQSGFVMPNKSSEGVSVDSGVPISMIIFGLVMLVYGFFIQPSK